jgi:putative membrane protein
MDWFLWMKSLHVVAVISWMAGLLYLPRLFVYHCEGIAAGDFVDTFKVMEWKLLRYIMNPAMIVTWASGLWLAWMGSYLSAGWFHGKFLLVLLLSGSHGLLSRERRRLEGGDGSRGSKYYRIINEIPTILMIGIVVLVIVKPF